MKDKFFKVLYVTAYVGIIVLAIVRIRDKVRSTPCKCKCGKAKPMFESTPSKGNPFMNVPIRKGSLAACDPSDIRRKLAENIINGVQAKVPGMNREDAAKEITLPHQQALDMAMRGYEANVGRVFQARDEAKEMGF